MCVRERICLYVVFLVVLWCMRVNIWNYVVTCYVSSSCVDTVNIFVHVYGSVCLSEYLFVCLSLLVCSQFCAPA